MVRAFIAIEAHTPTLEKWVARIHEFLSSRGVRFTPVNPKITHITIKFLGEISEMMVERVINELERIEFEPFRFIASGIGFFPSEFNPRVIYIDVVDGGEKITKLAELIEDRLTRIGFKEEVRRFKPHITVARVKSLSRVPVKELTQFCLSIREEVLVNELKLKKSVLSPSGPIYSDLYVKKLV